MKKNLEKVCYYLSVDQKEQLRIMAEKMSLSVSGVIRLAVVDFIKKNKEK